MTSPAPMSREELLELAALDALGLLDEYEAALYTRSFHHAPAAVQDEIKDLQAAYSADPTFLPDVKPASTVRVRVLGAVRRAIEQESLELAPLAMIGRKHLRNGAAVGGAMAIASSQFWRAATFVLAGVLVVVLYFSSQKNQDNHAIKDLAIDLLAEFQVQDLIAAEQDDNVIPDLLEFIHNPNCRSVVLRPYSDDATDTTTVDNSRYAQGLLPEVSQCPCFWDCQCIRPPQARHLSAPPAAPVSRPRHGSPAHPQGLVCRHPLARGSTPLSPSHHVGFSSQGSVGGGLVFRCLRPRCSCQMRLPCRAWAREGRCPAGPGQEKR